MSKEFLEVRVDSPSLSGCESETELTIDENEVAIFNKCKSKPSSASSEARVHYQSEIHEKIFGHQLIFELIF